MTREEVIRLATSLRTDFKCESETMVDFCNSIIKLVGQEPCDDAISRQTVLELLADYDLSMGQVVKEIHALPPVTPQQKIGRWISDEILDRYCSECKSIGVDYWNYCPNCGAKMNVEE